MLVVFKRSGLCLTTPYECQTEITNPPKFHARETRCPSSLQVYLVKVSHDADFEHDRALFNHAQNIILPISCA